MTKQDWDPLGFGMDIILYLLSNKNYKFKDFLKFWLVKHLQI